MTQEGILLHVFRPAAVINITGEDALGFLQGQFTNELRQPNGSATYGLWLNRKGRVIADSQVLRQAENEFDVISLTSPAAVISGRLEEFIVADDVVLLDRTATMAGLALSGRGSGALVGEVAGARPEAGKFRAAGGVWIFPGRRGAEESYEMIGPEAELSAWPEKFLGRGAQAPEPQEGERRRIAAGIPAVPSDLGPGDLPNEGGIVADAISYTKGCYLGQEVMARLKNLGQVRRQLRVLRGVGAPPAPSAALFQGQVKVGEIRSTAGKDGDFVALAMLSLINLDPGSGLSLGPEMPPMLTLEAHG